MRFAGGAINKIGRKFALLIRPSRCYHTFAEISVRSDESSGNRPNMNRYPDRSIPVLWRLLFAAHSGVLFPINADPRDRRARRLSAMNSTSFSPHFHLVIRRVESMSCLLIIARNLGIGCSRSQKRKSVSPRAFHSEG
jgi:hypothetical protein